MKEENKEEFIARIRKESGEKLPPEELMEEASDTRLSRFKDKLRAALFLLLLALFLWAILQIFGMLKSN